MEKLRRDLGATASPRFRVLALYENGGHHVEYSARARLWLAKLAADSNIAVDYLTHTDSISDELLARYQLILQLDYVPYGWKPAAMAAFQRYIEEGRGGWVGMHHASLLGEFDNYSIWPWFQEFMGGIRWKDYIARFARGTVHVEDGSHPVMKGIPDSFIVQKEEWYTYDKSPRPNVRVLAYVDESSYQPDTAIKMGDHPVVWTNERMKARNAYIFMGHSPILFDDWVYKKMLKNAIFWAAATPPPPAFKVLALYSTTVEGDHVAFAYDAIRFYSELAARQHFRFDTTSDWTGMSLHLGEYQVVVWLNDFPHTEEERTSFEHYMDGGGAWLGCHVSAYNDRDTHWPWFVQLLGGAVFFNNSWPPLPAKLIVEDRVHGATVRLPRRYVAPINEWYGWKPNPRTNPAVRVLVSLDTTNYPLGKKDILRSGDVPVVWTNTRYRMLYLNMGHGDQILSSPIQNNLFEDGLLWLGGGAKR
jgi:type 1 glutamine amidotransferase